ncbi:MAG: nucleotidyltransferase domain-containing protein [Cyanobacteria bacterium J06626_18]
MQHPQLAQILNELRQHFRMLYGSRLERLMVFGSQARKDADADSDIDVMVVLLGEVDAWAEIERTGELVANLCLAYGVVICNIFVSADRYRAQDCALIRNVVQEGIPL